MKPTVVVIAMITTPLFAATEVGLKEPGPLVPPQVQLEEPKPTVIEPTPVVQNDRSELNEVSGSTTTQEAEARRLAREAGVDNSTLVVRVDKTTGETQMVRVPGRLAAGQNLTPEAFLQLVNKYGTIDAKTVTAENELNAVSSQNSWFAARGPYGGVAVGGRGWGGYGYGYGRGWYGGGYGGGWYGGGGYVAGGYYGVPYYGAPYGYGYGYAGVSYPFLPYYGWAVGPYNYYLCGWNGGYYG